MSLSIGHILSEVGLTLVSKESAANQSNAFLVDHEHRNLMIIFHYYRYSQHNLRLRRVRKWTAISGTTDLKTNYCF